MDGEIITAAPVLDLDAENAAFRLAINEDETFTEEPLPTAETQPEEIEANPWDQAIAELREQVGRIPNLEKQLNDAGGRYGGLKLTVEQLQQRFSAPSAFTDAKANVDDLLKELVDGGLEDVAAMLRPAFSKLVTGTPSMDAVVDRVRGQMRDERTADDAATRVRSVAAIADAHPDWLDIVKRDADGKLSDPVFVEWMGTLPPRRQARVNGSTDPDYVSDVFDEFKVYRDSKKTQQQQPPQPSDRLQRAVQPDGVRTSQQRAKQQTEEDAFNAALKKR